MDPDRSDPPPAALAAAVAAALADLAVQPELLTLAAVLKLTSQSRSSLYRAVSGGTFPPPVPTPSGKRWKRKAVLDWVAKLRG